MDPYRPESLPIKDIDYSKLISLVGESNACIARYDASVQSLVNPDVLLSPFTNQEAVLSSKIEGTQATLEEVLEHEGGQAYGEEKELDIREILNYRRALILAAEHIQERPLNLGLILELHKILLDSVRGENKNPGKFRLDQNWIGKPGSPIEDATYVPPNPLVLQEYLLKWEEYLKFEDIDPLIQTAIIHAQFELLHPFKDGNGRIGRLMIPLFLAFKHRISRPVFYISMYLEKHRDEYYARLNAISKNREWFEWVQFFLKAVIEQSNQNTIKVENIKLLYKELSERIRHLTKSQYSHQALDAIFYRPIFNTNQFSDYSKIGKAKTHVILKQLLEGGILKMVRENKGRQSAIYAFVNLISIIEGAEIKL